MITDNSNRTTIRSPSKRLPNANKARLLRFVLNHIYQEFKIGTANEHGIVRGLKGLHPFIEPFIFSGGVLVPALTGSIQSSLVRSKKGDR